jgi:hypothetical protein
MAKAEMTIDITINGRPPVNPIGTCFDSAARVFITLDSYRWHAARICHGIGVSNLPGEEGEPIAHAWIEAYDKEHGRIAIDTTWMLAQPAKHYRENLQVSFVKDYTFVEFMQKWQETNYPGPWEEKLIALTKEGKQVANGNS